MTASIFLNGRFMSQPLTGVQRFSWEMTTAIDHLAARNDWPETVVLAPRGKDDGAKRPTTYRQLGFKEVGRTRGHLWEQAELPRAARSGVLISLGNTAPLLAGGRQVVVIHDAGVFDTPESYSKPFRAWYKTLQHGLARTGAHVVTVSKFSRKRIASRLGIDSARITVIYEGADHIQSAAADPGTLARHGLKSGGFALVVSNRVAHKKLGALRDAAAELHRRGMVIAVAGGFDPGVYQGNAADAAGFPEVRLGRVTDGELRALYENAACLLFPSRYEGFGLPPVEAMICGCPVLAARSEAVEEVCGNRALYFDNDAPCTSVAAIKTLLDEPGVADDLRNRGRTHAASYSWHASAQALGDVVRRVQ